MFHGVCDCASEVEDYECTQLAESEFRNRSLRFESKSSASSFQTCQQLISAIDETQNCDDPTRFIRNWLYIILRTASQCKKICKYVSTNRSTGLWWFTYHPASKAILQESFDETWMPCRNCCRINLLSDATDVASTMLVAASLHTLCAGWGPSLQTCRRHTCHSYVSGHVVLRLFQDWRMKVMHTGFLADDQSGSNWLTTGSSGLSWLPLTPNSQIHELM